MDDNDAGFGTILRACRRSAGLSQQELSEASGMSVRAISNLERGRTRWPYPGSLSRLADGLRLRDRARAEFISAAGRRLVNAPAARADAVSEGQLGRDDSAQNVPRQLLAPVRQFVGRDGELAALSGLLDQADTEAATMLISAIGGTAGVGKTALAIRWAYQVADRFPDGQLYVNLRGYDPGQAMPAADALAGFLRALGVPGQDVPAGVEERAARFRSLLAGRRMLVVLDNAGQVEQVRPLLPGSPGCVTVVTSRDALPGLVAREGAIRVELDLLPMPEAVGLLRALIGARVDAEPEAAAELAAQCARLPLGLRVAAELAAARPAASLAALAGELAGQQRLDLLDAGGDPRTGVRSVFSWSYRHLDAETARVFRLLGLHPGPETTVPAAASLAGITPPQARQAMRNLTEAYLVTEHTPGRYSLHDLLRAYAAEQAAEQEPQAERRAALQRMLDHYLQTAGTAALLLNPSREPVTLSPPRPGVIPEHLDGDQQALAWCEAEFDVLLGAARLAAETRSGACAWQLPWTMADFLDRRGHWHEWAVMQRTALTAAARLGDTAGQALARRLLAHACVRLARYDEAGTHLTECLKLYRQLGDHSGEGRIHQSLGAVAERQGRHADALRHAVQALALHEATGDLAIQATALNNVGWCHGRLGAYQQAQTFCRQALALRLQLADRLGEAHTWDSLGYIEYQLGNLTDAADCHHRALDIFRDLGDRYEEAQMLTHLGEVHSTAGDLLEAARVWQQALVILQDLQHPDAAQIRARLHQPGHPPGQARQDTSLTGRTPAKSPST